MTERPQVIFSSHGVNIVSDAKRCVFTVMVDDTVAAAMSMASAWHYVFNQEAHRLMDAMTKPEEIYVQPDRWSSRLH